MGRSILLINGPNLNLLGTREPHIYGHTTLNDIAAAATTQAKSLGASLIAFQSNHEGAIVDRIHEARGNVDAIVINPGAYTHTSVAIRDALLGVDIPFIELHLSNPHSRESFRHVSHLSDKAASVICGMGAHGYTAAVEFAANHLKIKDTKRDLKVNAQRKTQKVLAAITHVMKRKVY
uniref:Catabolic 3-dehydroquinase n=1 Tax=Bionectria ochroleuca TaxID=29856 RepID=A0A0B7K2V6_BIOOC